LTCEHGFNVEIQNGGLIDLREGGSMSLQVQLDFYDGTTLGGTIQTETLSLYSSGTKVQKKIY